MTKHYGEKKNYCFSQGRLQKQIFRSQIILLEDEESISQKQNENTNLCFGKFKRSTYSLNTIHYKTKYYPEWKLEMLAQDTTRAKSLFEGSFFILVTVLFAKKDDYPIVDTWKSFCLGRPNPVNHQSKCLLNLEDQQVLLTLDLEVQEHSSHCSLLPG